MCSMPSKPLLWGLVDCASFYCSCERLFRPDLTDKPVVVLSNNDGCLISLSPEAKALGFGMAEPYFKVKHKLEKFGVTAFSSNYTLYGDISNRVMRTLESLVPIEQYSIDECFVPVYSASATQVEDVGLALHNRVRQWVGIPVRVGFGPTRTLAKLANNWAKERGPVFSLYCGTKELEDILEASPVRAVWGIGRRQAEKLERTGIRTARQLRDMDEGLALKLLTITGLRTVLELRGESCIMEEQRPAPRRSMVSSRSFGHRVSDKQHLAEALSMHCTLAGQRLREAGLEAATLSVRLQSAAHGTASPTISSYSLSLPTPTNHTGALIQAARQALECCYQQGQSYVKGGIVLYDLHDKGTRQLTLMEAVATPEQQKQTRLMQVMDSVNDLYGKHTLRYLAEGASNASWHMQRSKLSGALTTSWKELARAKS